MPLREIAMYHFMKENAVEKTRNRALKKLREGWGGQLSAAMEYGAPVDQASGLFRGAVTAGMADLMGLSYHLFSPIFRCTGAC